MRVKPKVFIVLTCVILLCVLIPACGTDDDNGGGENRTDNGEIPMNNGEENPGENQESPKEILPDFPHEERVFNGKVFNILVENEPWNFLEITDFNLEEEPGDILGTAIYRRNKIVEEELEITINGIQATRDNIRATLRRSVASGTNDYDAAAMRLENAAPTAMDGQCVNLNNLDYLSLDMPWWDKNILSDLSVGGQSYLIAGDIFTKHYEGIAMMFFNKKLLSDHGVESPYRLVEENKWTLDEFGRLTKDITRDITGDGIIDHNDLFGFSTQADFLPSIVNGGGAKFIEKDNNDMPYFTGATEKIETILNKIFDFYMDDTFCAHRDAIDKNIDFDGMHQFMVFPAGRSLFFWGMPRFLDLELRNMDDDFGMLPIPKFDSSQDRYYATANSWHSYAMLIPHGSGNPEETAYIMDAMAYYGRIHILPAYYDVTLQRKHTRDEESSAMLDIIFSSAVYDIGYIYNLGSYVDNLMNMIRGNSNNMTSQYERAQGRIERDLGNLIERFESGAN
ncbi:MAG: hypothetical protein FWH10_05545 [Oscillospiraceae bacterium]|nr:hypothetical protein [Oscillospiraceae bacterium]